MATRTISTKLAISGESEYRSSLSRINQELKTLQSSLKLTESQYQNNANSMQALQAKGNDLRALYDAQKKKVDELRNALSNAQKAETEWSSKIAATKQKIADNEAALAKLKNTTGDTTKEQQRLTEEGEKLRKQLANEEAGLAAAEKGTNSWKDQLNRAEIQLNNLDAELQKNDKYLDEAKSSTDGCAHSIDEFGREVKESSEELKTMGTILASEELRQGMEKVVSVLKDCVTASADFQSEMAKVRATTGMSESEIKALGDRFKELSTEIPLTTSEMAKIAAAAGQFGIANDQIESFTISMARLASASDTTADSISTLIAQFSNVTGEKDFERLASTLTRLNYNSATTASNIMEMSQGFAAAGKLAGLSAQEILAISAAVTSTGQGSQTAATAMQRLIEQISLAVGTGKHLEEFASVSGMTAGQFKKAWGEDAVGVLARLVEAFDETNVSSSESAALLEELGINSSREKQAIESLANAELSLDEAIAIVNDEWQKNTALTEAAAIKGETLNAKLDELDNASNNLKIAVGDALAPALTKATEAGTDMVKGITGFVEKHPELTQALSITAGSIAAITTGIASAKAAWKAADFLGMTGPFKSVAEAASAAGGGISGLVSALGTIAIPAAAAATALLSIVTIAERCKELNTVGLLGEGHTLEEYADNVDKYRQQIEQLQQDYENLALYGGDLTMVQDALDVATIALTNAQEELTAAEEAAGNAATAAAESQEGLTQSVEAAKYTLEDAKYEISEIAEAYKNSYDAAKQSLEGQIGLFDSYAASINEDTDTAAELLARWSEQTANLGQYTENLKTAAALGLDSGLVKALADGSPEAAGYLAVILEEVGKADQGLSQFGNTSKEVVEAFNASFQETEKAKESLETRLAAIDTSVGDMLASIKQQLGEDVSWTEYMKIVDELFADAGVKFEGYAKSEIDGLIGGLGDGKGDYTSAVEDVAQAGEDAFKQKEGIASPSRVFREFGRNLDAGLADGIQQGEAHVISTLESVTRQMNGLLESSSREGMTTFTSNYAALVQVTAAHIQSLREIVFSGTQGMDIHMQNIGAGIVDGMISGIYSRSGSLYYAVQSVVNSAISAARSAAAVASPSKKTKEIFENVGEGMVVGIESKKGRIKDATQNVVDRALDMKIDTSRIEKLMSKAISGDTGISRMLEKMPGRINNTSSIQEGDTIVNLNTPQIVIREEADIRRVSAQLAQQIKLERRSRGI